MKPYHQNLNKRIIRTPKLYFIDSALVCHLLEIESPHHLQSHVHRGAIFEEFVLTEIIKYYAALGQNPPLYCWRDHLGLEVDVLIAKEKYIAIEAKSAATFIPSLLNEIKKWKK